MTGNCIGDLLFYSVLWEDCKKGKRVFTNTSCFMNKDTELPACIAVRQKWCCSWCYIPVHSLACFPIWFRKQNLQSFPTPPEETTGACLLLLGDYHRHYSISSRSFLCCWWRESISSRRDTEQNAKAAVFYHIWKALSFSTNYRAHGNGPY